MSSATPEYEVYALRYAHAPQSAIRTFLLPNPHDGPLAMDFYVWAIRGDSHTIIVDTGFKAAVAARRRPEWQLLDAPDAALSRIGIDAAHDARSWCCRISTGTIRAIPIFSPRRLSIVQDAEIAFRTGRYMTHPFFAARAEIDDVLTTVRHVYAGRVRFHDGSGEIAPGVTLHLVGGHTAGMQVVRVPTSRGWVVLASDAAHYWANLRQRHPFPLVLDVGKMLEGFRLMEELADGPDHIIPGHDPEVVAALPRASRHARHRPPRPPANGLSRVIPAAFHRTLRRYVVSCSGLGWQESGSCGWNSGCGRIRVTGASWRATVRSRLRWCCSSLRPACSMTAPGSKNCRRSIPGPRSSVAPPAARSSTSTCMMAR